MLQYIFRRLIGMIPLLFLISVVVFFLGKMMPGDALTGQIDPTNTSPEYIAEMREKLGLNDPIHEQYLRWIGGYIKGDLGRSFVHKLPVADIIGQRFLNTVYLSVLSLAITLIVAFPIGIYTGKHPFTLGDRVVVVLNFISISIPTVIAAIVAIYLFAIKLGWFPAMGSIAIGLEKGTMAYHLSKLKHTLLPALVVGLLGVVGYIQHLRNEIIDASRMDYVRTARAKGTSEQVIFRKHILRNSMIPIVTFLGFEIGGLFAGSVLIETIFTYPGIGQLMMESLTRRDFSVVMALTMIFTLSTLVGNLLADIFYGVVDPRIRY